MLVKVGVKRITYALLIVLDHPPSTFELMAPPFFIFGRSGSKCTFDTSVGLDNYKRRFKHPGIRLTWSNSGTVLNPMVKLKGKYGERPELQVEVLFEWSRG